MSDDKPVDGPQTPKPHDETQPIGASTPAESAPAPDPTTATAPQPTEAAAQPTVPPAAPAAPRQRFVDRLWGLKAMIAVALAAVILGGVGGAAIAKAGDDGDVRRFGPGGRHGGFMHQGGPGGFGQQNGRQHGPRGGFGQNGQPGGQDQGQFGVVPQPPSPSSTPSPSKNS